MDLNFPSWDKTRHRSVTKICFWTYLDVLETYIPDTLYRV